MPEHTREAIRVRDELNKLIQSVDGETDHDTEIIRCCLAVGQEELENWLYDGKFTPSVAPVADITGENPHDLQLRLPRHWTDAEKEHFGLGLKSQFIRSVRAAVKPSPSLTVAKAYAERMVSMYSNLWKASLIDLDMRTPDHWEDDEKEAFKKGRVIEFLKAVRTHTNSELKPAKEYLARMRDEHAHLWNVDANGWTS